MDSSLKLNQFQVGRVNPVSLFAQPSAFHVMPTDLHVTKWIQLLPSSFLRSQSVLLIPSQVLLTVEEPLLPPKYSVFDTSAMTVEG